MIRQTLIQKVIHVSIDFICPLTTRKMKCLKNSTTLLKNNWLILGSIDCFLSMHQWLSFFNFYHFLLSKSIANYFLKSMSQKCIKLQWNLQKNKVSFLFLFPIGFILIFFKASTQFHTTMRTNCLNLLQILELFGLSWIFICYQFRLGITVSLCKFFVPFSKGIKLPQLNSSVFYFFRIWIQLINDMMNLSVCYVVLSTLCVRTLGR